MHIDLKFKIKIVIILLLTIFTYLTGISIMDSNIRDLKSKRDFIENINTDVSMLVSISNRIYTLDDRIDTDISRDVDFESNSKYMSLLSDGLFIFSNADSAKLDSMMDLKFSVLRDYKEDTVYCDDDIQYHSRNVIINREIRKILKSSISNSLDCNNKKLKEVLDDYEDSYNKSIIAGSIIIFLLAVLLAWLLRDVVILIRSNTRTKSTIEDLFRYIKSKK